MDTWVQAIENARQIIESYGFVKFSEQRVNLMPWEITFVLATLFYSYGQLQEQIPFYSLHVSPNQQITHVLASTLKIVTSVWHNKGTSLMLFLKSNFGDENCGLGLFSETAFSHNW